MNNPFEFNLNKPEKILLCKALNEFLEVKKSAFQKSLRSFPHFLPSDFGLPQIKTSLTYIANSTAVENGDVEHFELVVLEADLLLCLRSLEELSKRQALALIEARSVLPQNKIAAFRRSDFDLDEIEALIERLYKLMSLF
jgi:hypothetical protein